MIHSILLFYINNDNAVFFIMKIYISIFVLTMQSLKLIHDFVNANKMLTERQLLKHSNYIVLYRILYILMHCPIYPRIL